ncbi:MAG: GNAT family N-acetyltransferase [Candidatus Izemoplasmatales bacterium]|nr:GNAT family N-acetyltransferase [Candidatus Izemoplasmatales bacterium]
MIRKANNDDLDILDKMARMVADNLHRHGIDQWSNIYPTRQHFANDLKKNGLYICEIAGNIVGSISLLDIDDETYQTITWRCTHSQVIHRMMVDPGYLGKGIGTVLIQFAIDLISKNGYDSIKVDTHPDNIRMKKILLAFGFKESGYLTAINRDAFELVFEKN